jgi:hypothetical protein
MSDTEATTVRLRPLRRRWDSRGLDAVVAMSVSFLLLVPTGLLSLPPSVDALTFDNPIGYVIDVQVSDETGESWMAVTRAGPTSTTRVVNVIDQGDVWRFRFRGQGHPGGEMTVPRADLIAADWHVQIPVEVGERLAALGAPSDQ